MKPSIGWIGLGNMGIPMARNVIKAGFPLYVNNRTPEKAGPLLELGAAYCATPRELAETCDIVVTMLANAPALNAVLYGDDGLLAGLKEGQLVVDMSTISPEDTAELADVLKRKGIRFVDAPVSGSVKPAEDGQLVILAGGEAENVQDCQPLFDVLGKSTIHFGANGSGSLAKLVINLLLGITMQGIAESLVLAEKMGLDRQQVLRMMSESAVSTPLLAGKATGLINESFPAAFALKWMEKDLGFAIDAARKLETSLPLASAAVSTYTAAKATGKGELDVAAIFLQLKEMSGMKSE